MYKTPKKLKKIEIMGTTVAIEINDVKLAANNAMGLYGAHIITLASAYPSMTDYVDTLTHECFHALQAILGTQLDPHLEEIMANTMGQMNIHIINALLQHNTLTAEASA